ncbi:hypothetical protein HMPREF3213_02133 [Heyndrickxia coagulans]|uniref:Uncharacterized protein n=1 Tax=Heyndrickxia coagulans TaxID=1398 RepID=A0A133KNJ0_HEYCO|nr:hypothetical protein HMPREF3213_02133 [Heyndrickxia coagulans]
MNGNKIHLLTSSLVSSFASPLSFLFAPAAEIHLSIGWHNSLFSYRHLL